MPLPENPRMLGVQTQGISGLIESQQGMTLLDAFALVFVGRGMTVSEAYRQALEALEERDNWTAQTTPVEV